MHQLISSTRSLCPKVESIKNTSPYQQKFFSRMNTQPSSAKLVSMIKKPELSNQNQLHKGGNEENLMNTPKVNKFDKRNSTQKLSRDRSESPMYINFKDVAINNINQKYSVQTSKAATLNQDLAFSSTQDHPKNNEYNLIQEKTNQMKSPVNNNQDNLNTFIQSPHQIFKEEIQSIPNKQHMTSESLNDANDSVFQHQSSQIYNYQPDYQNISFFQMEKKLSPIANKSHYFDYPSIKLPAQTDHQPQQSCDTQLLLCNKTTLDKLNEENTIKATDLNSQVTTQETRRVQEEIDNQSSTYCKQWKQYSKSQSSSRNSSDQDDMEHSQMNKSPEKNEFKESLILTDVSPEILKVLPGNLKSPRLLYRLSEDGSSSSIFHEKCDGQGQTITLVKANGEHIFGYYMPISFTSSDQYSTIDKSFIFTLKNSLSITPTRFVVRPERKFIAIYQNSKNPCLGSTLQGKQDLFINFDCLEKSCSNIGYAYTLQNEIDGNKILAGSYSAWNISEIEIFAI